MWWNNCQLGDEREIKREAAGLGGVGVCKMQGPPTWLEGELISLFINMVTGAHKGGFV